MANTVRCYGDGDMGDREKEVPLSCLLWGTFPIFWRDDCHRPLHFGGFLRFGRVGLGIHGFFRVYSKIIQYYPKSFRMRDEYLLMGEEFLYQLVEEGDDFTHKTGI